MKEKYFGLLSESTAVTIVNLLKDLLFLDTLMM